MIDILQADLQPVLSKLLSANASGYLNVNYILIFTSRINQMIDSQLPHGIDDRPGEGRCFVSGVGAGAHYCCPSQRCAKHK